MISVYLLLDYRVMRFLSDDAGLACPLHDFGNVTECEAGHSVGATVIYGYPTCLRVVYLGTGETYVGHIACELVLLTWCDEVGAAAVDGFPRLFEVEQRRTEAVDVAVAGAEHTMIEEQPSLAGLDGDGACTYLHALPCLPFGDATSL